MTSLIGHLPPDYESLPAQAKQDILWEQVNKNPYDLDSLPTKGISWIKALNQLWPHKIIWPFTHRGDERIAGRPRLVHPYGSVVKADFIIEKSPYTGIFRSDTNRPAIVRCSIGLANQSSFLPGVSVKVLVDGEESKNMIALNSLETQGNDRNYFENPLSTSLPARGAWTLKMFVLKRFLGFVNFFIPGKPTDRPENPLILPMRVLAEYNTKPEDVLTPFSVTYLPNESLGWSPVDRTDFRVHLAELPHGGLKLFDIAARRSKDEPDEIIGQLRTTSGFVASEYGDQGVFFQHHARRS